ncbi:hypothetical protein [Grimontia sp. NTOU-MAR1]|uniref:hypothetical protein n=1 Tax=Grimontia sp. NTOU-MAR1 TaxID=3111011 RepID=UPI002DBF2D14|nr:hypothetical protein [Grimontia sp. NTOU-MAR1]WRW00743.1 hypothetical protein VP504_20055 [Grimontia sp. NTOU-MAR1]
MYKYVFAALLPVIMVGCSSSEKPTFDIAAQQEKEQEAVKKGEVLPEPSSLYFVGSNDSQDYDPEWDATQKTNQQKLFIANGDHEVTLFTDHLECKDPMGLNMESLGTKSMTMPRGEKVTLNVSFHANSFAAGGASCVNTFTFNVDEGKSYTVNHKFSLEDGLCTVSVFDDEAKAAIDVFARKGPYLCTPEDLNEDNAAQRIELSAGRF